MKVSPCTGERERRLLHDETTPTTLTTMDSINANQPEDNREDLSGTRAV